MKAIDELERACRAVQTAWEDEASALQDENGKLQAKVDELEQAAITFDSDTNLLADAIYEGRRQDAIDILNAMVGSEFRTVREQANLFPERVAS